MQDSNDKNVSLMNSICILKFQIYWKTAPPPLSQKDQSSKAKKAKKKPPKHETKKKGVGVGGWGEGIQHTKINYY